MAYAGATYAGQSYATQGAISAATVTTAALPFMLASLHGDVFAPTYSGTLAGALASPTVQLSGTSVIAVGALDAGVPAVTATLGGTALPPDLFGTLQVVLGGLESTFVGGLLAPVTATLDAFLPSLSVDLAVLKSASPPSGPSARSRWTLYDPLLNEQYQFPLNPNKMSTPHSPRNFTIIATAPSGVLTGGSRGGMGRVVELAREPFEWSFSGRIKTEAHYEELLRWATKTYRVQLTDHLGRTWSIRALAFNPNELIPTPKISWRYEYDFKALNYGLAT